MDEMSEISNAAKDLTDTSPPKLPVTVFSSIRGLESQFTDFVDMQGQKINFQLLKNDETLVHNLIRNLKDAACIVVASTIRYHTLRNLLTLLRMNMRGRYIPLIFIGNLRIQRVEIIKDSCNFIAIEEQSAQAKLRQIIAASVAEFQQKYQLLEDLESVNQRPQSIKNARFEIKSFEEAQILTKLLSSSCPDPQTAALGLAELLINSIEHGNLDISYEDKAHHMADGTWSDFLKSKQSVAKYMIRKVSIDFKRSDTEISFHITDQGNGFDWRPFLRIEDIDPSSPHGRGIAFANELAFDNLQYLEPGNQVVATIKR